MFSKLHEFLRHHFVDDVPAEMDLCLDCGVVNCPENRFKDCASRKAHAANLTGGSSQQLPKSHQLGGLSAP
jgi:hypothetical protein